MGMFTEVLDPVTEEYVQFKTGKDEGERYTIGDLLTWEIKDEDEQSDVFDGLGYKVEERAIYKDYFVVVVDKRIIAVVPSITEDTRWEEEQLLRLFYNINPQFTWEGFIDEVQLPHWYNKLWEIIWPWSERNKQRRRYKDSDPKELARVFCEPIRQQINYESLSRRIFTVNPIEQQESENDL